MNSFLKFSQALAATLCLCSVATAQQTNCGTDMLPKDPKQLQYKQWYEQQVAGTVQKPATVTYTIPVVFHVIETGTVLGSPQRPSDAQIIASVDALNKTFSATYPGYPSATTGGVEVGFHFELAKRDPDCNPTNGIHRIDKSHDSAFINSFITIFDTQVLTNLARWNVTEYCNFYVCATLVNGGFATPPMPGYISQFDGIALNAWQLPPFYNYNPPYVVPNPPYTITHEFGHYLGLTHTFNMANGSVCSPNADCLAQGDQICDTDPHLEACPTATCNVSSINPCTGQPLGTLFSNYMSYFTDTIGLFTPGQKARMHQQSGLYRSSLYTSLGATPPQTSTPVISLTGYPQNGFIAYCSGDSVNMYISGTGHGTSPVYTWYINGIATATTTNQGPKALALHTTDTVTCMLTSSALCASTPTVMSAKFGFPLLSGGTLAPAFTRRHNDTLCVGDSVNLYCNVTNPGNYIFYWGNQFYMPMPMYNTVFPNNHTEYHGIIDTNIMMLPFVQGWMRYTCAAVPQTHCTTPSFITMRDSVFVMRPPSKPSLSFVSNYLQCTPAPTYQWYSVSNGLINGATAQTYTPTQGGDYYCVTGNNYCHSRPSDTLTFLSTGVEAYDLNIALRVYPNPATDEVIIRSNAGNLQHIELLSLSGQLLRRYDPVGPECRLHLSELSAGLYMLRIRDQRGFVAHQKLMLESSR